MRCWSRVVGMVGVAVLCLGTPLHAEEGALCLQKQLAALGHDPGKADGRVGPATRRALEEYEEKNGRLADRTLDNFSAIIFCRELGLQDSALAREWPSSGRRLRVEIAGERDDQLRADLIYEANAALSTIEALFDLQLAAPVDIVFGSDPDEIAERAKGFTESSGGAVERSVRRLCREAPVYGVNGTYLPGVILFCQRPDAVYHGGFPPREVRNVLGRLMAMELIFQLTGYPANGSDEEYFRRTGPMWLIVGTMQLLQREVDAIITPLGRQNAAKKLRAEGILNPSNMEYYQSSLEDPVEIGRTGLLVTDDLTRESGLALIGVFYRALGTGLSVDEAFERAFGKTRQAVYEGYP